MAATLYANTLQIVLKANLADGNSWSYIYGSLCCLRESLLCNVCRNVTVNPVRPISAKCQHNICKRCVGSKEQTKCHCKSCAGFKKYEENAKNRIVSRCYKKLCQLIMSSGIFRCLRERTVLSPMLRFVSMVCEGAGLKVKNRHPQKYYNGPFRKSLSTAALPKYGHGRKQSVNGQTTVYSMQLNNTKSPKVMIKKAKVMLKKISVGDLLADYSDSDESSDTSGFDSSTMIPECLRSVKKRKSCRCGMARRKCNPRKLTCCGQRCPCYVEGRACISCRCKGCRNPQKKLISSPATHNFRTMNDVSPESNDMHVDLESFDETSSSDSEKEPSV